MEDLEVNGVLEQDVDGGLEDDIVCVISSKGVVDVNCVGVVGVDSEFGGDGGGPLIIGGKA
jgi:hypothetical protein